MASVCSAFFREMTFECDSFFYLKHLSEHKFTNLSNVQNITQMLENYVRNVEKKTAQTMFAHTYKVVLRSRLEHMSTALSAL